MGTDKVTALFFLFLSIYVCLESYLLGLGTLSNPKAGLFPFISGVVLGFFSFLGLFDKPSLKEAFKDAGRNFFQWKFQKISYVLIVLVGYAFFLKAIGFLICTFLFVFSIYEIVEPRKVKRGILIALVSTVASHLVFQILIKAHLPRGFLGI